MWVEELYSDRHILRSNYCHRRSAERLILERIRGINAAMRTMSKSEVNHTADPPEQKNLAELRFYVGLLRLRYWYFTLGKSSHTNCGNYTA